MAFTESKGEKQKDHLGIPANWGALKNFACPKCEKTLVTFDHVQLYKCECGFKISMNKFDEIVTSLHTRSRGFEYGNYDDEDPF